MAFEASDAPRSARSASRTRFDACLELGHLVMHADAIHGSSELKRRERVPAAAGAVLGGVDVTSAAVELDPEREFGDHVNMREVRAEAFLRSPIEQWTAVAKAIVWCHSPTLCGAVVWGQPDAVETRQIVHLLDVYRHADVAHQFSAVLDVRAIGPVDRDALEFLFAWLQEHMSDLQRRVSMQVGIIRLDPHGLTLAGIYPALGGGPRYCVFREAHEAFHFVLPDGGRALADEIDQITTSVQGMTPDVRRVRDLLSMGEASIDEVARKLGVSTRSLQRMLSQAGTSFTAEQLSVRFQAACQLLVTTDDRISSVAARIRVSERALELYFRRHTGLTPTEYRIQHRRKR